MSAIHLICAADLHLGRQVGSRSGSSCVIQAWNLLVEACLASRPKADALLLAGDLIDRNGLFIEMHGIFRKGVLRLVEQGVQVIAIAGNHDAKVLDQFHRAFALPGFCLLGADGKWERQSFRIRGRTLHVDGISFTESFLLENPLASRAWDAAAPEDALVGLLHCDVDAAASKYGPVRSADFQGLPHHAWILGHVHIPREIRTERPLVRYCGSLQGLDIGASECGPRGAWRLTIDPGGIATVEFLPLALLRWEQVRVDLSTVSFPDWEGQVLKKIEEALTEQAGEISGASAWEVRLRFEGRTSIYRELRRNLVRFQEKGEFRWKERWVPYSVESIQNNTRPQVDLKSLAEGKNMAAVLAKKLLQMQDDRLAAELVYADLQKMLEDDPLWRRWRHEKVWSDEVECRELYLSQGYELLDELLAQRRGSL